MQFELKKTVVLGALLGSVMAAGAAAQPVGYATLNGGTTGGAGGDVVYASTGTEIHAALCNRPSSDTPVIIHVEGTINHGNTSKVSGDSCNTADGVIEIKDVSNVSIIGVGNGALFDELGIHLRNSSNIILQNLHVRNVKKSGSPTSNGGDAIGMESNVYNVWGDHLTLEASGGESEGYDALFDMKATTKYVTLSYSILRNSGRGGLVGSSDSDDNNGPVTFHHNLYENIDSRTPLLRHATAHAYNNHYVSLNKSGMNPRIGGVMKAENNYFEDSKDPLGTFYTDDMGYWDVSGNIFSNVTWTAEDSDNHPAGPNPVSTTTLNVPYSYTLDDAGCVPQIILATAGANKGLLTSDGNCQSSSSSSSSSSSGGSSSSSSSSSSGGASSSSSSSSGGTSSGGSAPGELGANLSIGAGSDGSSKGSGSYGDVRDGDLSSAWQPSSASGERVSIKWSSATSFNTVIIRESGDAVQDWRLVNNDTGAELASGTGIGSALQVYLGDVSMSKINLQIDSASSAPYIAEFEVYNATGDVGSSSSSSSSSGGSSSGSSSSSSSSSGGNGGTVSTLVLQEAEAGFCAVDGALETEHAGYTGFGYANTENTSGAGIDWSVVVPAAGTYTLEYRYANGSGDRPANVMVNGASAAAVAMGVSGGWTSYTTESVTVTLAVGYNEIRLQATSGNGLANIDSLAVTGLDPAAGDCAGGSDGGSSSGGSSSSSSSSSSGAGSSSSSSSSSSGGSSSGSSSSSSSSGSGSSSGGAFPSPDVSNACYILATDPNVNWRDSSELDTDQEIVECLFKTLGRAVGYGENALGGYDPDGNSTLTVITKNDSQGRSVEQQILDAVTGDEPNWIVFDKFEFANETEVAMYRNFCGDTSVQAAIGGTAAQCVDYRQWCADNGYNDHESCMAEFFNDRLNDQDLPIRNTKIGSRKTLDGRQANAYFRFNGFAIGADSAGQPTQTSEHVILTHLDFRGAGHTEDHGLDPDMIRNTGASHEIWIHKNTFDTTGDSAFDVKVGAYNITMSFNKLVNVKRAALHGSSDSRTINAQIRTTMHHNAFITTDDHYSSLGNTLRRVPLIRRGTTHMFDNFFMNYRKDTLSVRVGASVLWEDNMFLMNSIHQEKDDVVQALNERGEELARDVDDGNFRSEGSKVWFSDAACNLDPSLVYEIADASGSVADLKQDYSQYSRDLIAAERRPAGQALADYVAATAGKSGEIPFNSPLGYSQNYVIGLGEVDCQ
ncbi:carbohydrate-binding protein [Microbulbifer pacificus]|uniref:pectate lyase family protein n=1 Tax=Microbulbifer pacificus TaxID=407164 RepID=UPI000CF49064|nr:carbohydrate-binding protein [Microbulbifer pacificus]